TLVRLARAIDARASRAGQLVFLSRSLESLGEADARRELLERARDAHPDDFWINFTLAWFDTQALPPRREEAVRYSSVPLALRPLSPRPYSLLGLALRGRGDMAGAEASFRRAIALGPDYAPSHYNLGLALGDRGDKVGAEASFRRAVALKPDIAYTHNVL